MSRPSAPVRCPVVDNERTVAAVLILTLVLAGLSVTRPARAGSVAPCGWTMASKSKDDKASRATYDWPAMDGSVSSNGRYIAFSTDARNLTRSDDDKHSDVFLRDVKAGTIKLVGRGVNGRNLNDDAWGGQVTPDGKYLLFSTGATNAHPKANGAEQIYRRNLRNGRVRLVSRGVTGEPANISTGGGAITPDGRYVVFTSPGTNMQYGSSHSNDFSFYSYVRDIKRGETTVATVDRSGRVIPASARSISADGRLVTFTNGDVFVRNLRRKRTIRISRNYDGSRTGSKQYASNPYITPNGRYVMFTSRSPKIVRGDTNGAADVFVYDRRTKEVVRASVGTSGRQADRKSQGTSISNDGKLVAFISRALNLDKRAARGWNGFAHDLVSGRTRMFTICDDGTPTSGYQGNPDPFRISGNKKTIVAAAQTSNWAPESSQGPQYRYQVYHRRFSILPPSVLTTTGPYSTNLGVPIDLSATVVNRKGKPLEGVTVKFRVAARSGEIVWRETAATDGSGTATVSHLPLETGRYEVTTIVPETDTHARAEMSDELAVGV